MSDLCYNCGDCHLPRPCTVALKYCEICSNLGHTYNFCPMSVRRKDPGYQFWALCHNCDKWHLPDPCSLELHPCRECGNGGHLEFFCPVKPLQRGTPPGQSAGAKRQRTNSSDAIDRGQVAPEVVQKIRTDAAVHIFAMLNQGYSHEDIMRHIAPRTVNRIATNPAQRMDSQNDSALNTPTPAPTQIHSTRNENAPGLYTIMQDRFERGDLKLGPIQTLVHRNGNQYAQNVQPTDGTFAQYNGSHYADNIHSEVDNVPGSGENINVRTPTALQQLAQHAISGPVTTGDPSVSLLTTANNIVGPASQAQNFGEDLAHTLATTIGDYNARTPPLANIAQNPTFAAPESASAIAPNTGLRPFLDTANVTAGENKASYQTHTLPPQTAEDSIAVGATEQEVTPPLALRKDGKPKKRQPTRNQPPRKKAA